MEESSALPRPFVARLLPWLLGTAFLVLYLVTLHPWIGITNGNLAAQLGGWDADLAYTEPLLWLLTRPLRLLPETSFPVAMNGLAAVMAALSVALLARSVALMPHDRMREQRIRGHGENPTLHIPLAWVPVVFAAGLLGWQLTFWENATLQTGEMLDLLLFAVSLAALVEYRLDLRERWLWLAALAFGAGITNNWAMIGFAPIFLMAVIWLRGWSFFETGFLLRMTAFGAAGLACYLLLPLGAAVSGSSDLGFWQTLKANLTIQKSYLLGVPRGRGLLLGLVAVLPLGLIAIRWQGSKGSSLERIAGLTAIVLLQVMWLVLAVFMAFDPAFSPRKLMYLDEGSGGLALLTFSFTSALAAGYFVGWFLLVGGTDPDKNWDQSSPLLRAAGRLVAGVVTVGALGFPLALAVRNWPAIRAQNSPATGDLARALVDQIPQGPALVLSDDAVATRLVLAELQRRPGALERLVVDTRRAPDQRYRNWLAERHQATRPELKAFAEARENVAGVMGDLVVQAVAAGSVRYLNPSFGFFFERVRLVPEGILFSLTPAPAEFVRPPVASNILAAASGVWTQHAPRWESVIHQQQAKAPDGRVLGSYWSRAGNALAVELQRAGQLDAAGRMFASARRINPDNLVAEVNGKVNEALRNNQPLATNLIAPLVRARSPLVQTLNTDGPVDEPAALLDYGQALLASSDRLPRQGWEAMHRSLQLAPDNLAAQMGEVEALIQGGMLVAARQGLDQLKTRHPPASLDREGQIALTRLEIFYALMNQDVVATEKLIEKARGQFANDTLLLDLLSALYIRQGRLDEAVPLLEQWRKLRLEDPAATVRLSTILIGRNQFEPALRLLDQFLAQRADNQAARINRAICLLQLGRLDESRTEYQGLVKKLPDLPMLHFGLAEIAVRRKDTNAALKHFDQYLKIAPTNTTEFAEVTTRVKEMRGSR